MPNSSPKKTCLALFLKPNARISDAALLRAKPFIDAWIIFSQDLETSEKLHVNNLMSGTDGSFIDTKFRNYGEAKTALLHQAQQVADWSILLEADEEFCILKPDLCFPSSDEVGIIDVHRGAAITPEARLFSDKCVVSFDTAVGDSANVHGASIRHVSEYSIRGQMPYHDLAGDKVANRFLMDAVLGKFQANAELSLSLGKMELANGQLSLALEHFNAVLNLSSSNSVLWSANYLAGAIYSEQRNLVRAVECWQTSFELMPSRAEPLMRLAQIHFEAQDYETAVQLAQAASEIAKPSDVDYYEPAVYTHKAIILKALALHNTDRSEEAMVCLKELLPKHSRLEIRDKISASLAKIEQEISANLGCNEPSFSSAENVSFKTSDGRNCPPSPKLTIGMATHDDYDGVYFSVMSLVLYHSEFLEDVEILIIDNNPDSKHGEAVRGLSERVAQVRYIAAREYQGTAIRERVFHEARGEYVLCMDCHVFLHAGALGRLINYFDANPTSPHILHGPIYYDDHHSYSTHMTPDWQSGFYGRWGQDKQGGEVDNTPFEIPLQGLGLFACVKASWPGFNIKFRGFGGEEGYIHEKFRQNGGKALCLPFLRWTHRFDRPNAPTYHNSWEDRVRNYLIGWDELGLDQAPILIHFSELLGEAITSSHFSKFLIEKTGPLWSYDTVYLHSDKAFDQDILLGLGANRIVKTTTKKDGLQKLLIGASKQQLPNVLLLVAKTDQQLTFETALCESAPQLKQLNADTEQIQLLESSSFQASLIPASAIQQARSCITDKCLLDVDRLNEAAVSVSINQVKP